MIATNKLKGLLFAGFLALLAIPVSAKENINSGAGNTPPAQTTNRNDCNPSSSQVDLNINNVRARLLGGGDLWWDLADGKYIIPNVPAGEIEISSIFAASIWVGGFDDGGNLKLAAQTYRQTGNDFWPGPLDEDGNVDQTICSQWDRHFTVLGANIEALREDYLSDDDGDGESDNSVNTEPSDDLLLWPAKGNPDFAQRAGYVLPNQDLAPFFDVDGDGLY
ncbi:MAG: hypothetical protein AAFV80_05015, partial [Bacteroidota bacterium]